MTLAEAKYVVNNTNQVVRPINEDGELSFYSFRVIDGKVYDSKCKVVNEKEWDKHDFIVET